jgi:2',3'-cyclic-nucleotide 2'-phosphodiesterase (5'-nucleotidase family)
MTGHWEFTYGADRVREIVEKDFAGKVDFLAQNVTIVTNAGSNGKFLAVLDLDVKGGKVADFRYRLLPVFSNLLPPTRRWIS